MRLRVQTFDEIVVKWVERIPDDLVSPFVWLGRLTSPALWMALLVTLQVVVVTPGILPLVAAAVIVFMPLATVIKFFFRRKRPATVFVASMRIKSYSFPSSHAYSAVVATGYLAYVTWHIHVAVSIACLVLAGVIGISRIRIGAHYPTDVAAGWVLGGVVLSVILSIFGR